MFPLLHKRVKRVWSTAYTSNKPHRSWGSLQFSISMAILKFMQKSLTNDVRIYNRREMWFGLCEASVFTHVHDVLMIGCVG